jgi:glycosyltransferase involved in cell wall biosynthesis
VTRSLHVITSDDRRGAETFAVDLAGTLRGEAQQAEVVALQASGSAAVHDVRILGRGRRDPRALQALRRAALRADVVVAHGSSTLEASTVALLGTDVPVVYRSIGDPRYWVRDRHRHWLVRRMLRRTDRVVALWPGAAEQLRRRYDLQADRVVVIPNGVPSDRFSDRGAAVRYGDWLPADDGPDARTLAYVGALSPEKDVATAIRAVAHTPGAVLLIAGNGRDEASLRALADAEAPGRVRFLGAITDVRAVYAASELLLLPSRTEGMPAVVIEAGLSGVASVATRVGALPEMIDDGVTGLLVEPGDQPAFTAAVGRALAAPERLGRAAAEAFESRYDIVPVTRLWGELLARYAPASSGRSRRTGPATREREGGW